MLRSGALNYDTLAASDSSAPKPLDIDVPRTVQSAKDETDINTIVRRFGVTGQVVASGSLPSYGDFSGVFDFQSAMNSVRRAEEAFNALPATVRRQFGNNPQAFLEFSSDPENIDALRKMGLAKAKEGDKIPADIPPVKEKKDGKRDVGRGTGKGAKAPVGSDSDGDSDSDGS